MYFLRGLTAGLKSFGTIIHSNTNNSRTIFCSSPGPSQNLTELDLPVTNRHQGVHGAQESSLSLEGKAQRAALSKLPSQLVRSTQGDNRWSVHLREKHQWLGDSRFP